MQLNIWTNWLKSSYRTRFSGLPLPTTRFSKITVFSLDQAGRAILMIIKLYAIIWASMPLFFYFNTFSFGILSNSEKRENNPKLMQFVTCCLVQWPNSFNISQCKKFRTLCQVTPSKTSSAVFWYLYYMSNFLLLE